MDQDQVWSTCLAKLQTTCEDEHAFNTWLGPLQPEIRSDAFVLWAPNEFVLNRVQRDFAAKIEEVIGAASGLNVLWQVGSRRSEVPKEAVSKAMPAKPAVTDAGSALPDIHHLNPKATFDTFVVGASNEMAFAAAQQVVENPGRVYNPVYFYGSSGLGKTHLMHGIGNALQVKHPKWKVICVHSERFVSAMVHALRHNEMDRFKKAFRGIQVALFDDIQFIANKPRTQEEFFATFVRWLEDEGVQVVLTCDRYPKELEGFDERLISRFSGGLTVAIEPPDLETRVAILISKAQLSGVQLPEEVAFFIAHRVRLNVRELEGALKRVLATAHFTGKSITMDFAQDTLKDLLNAQAKSVTLDNIQKTTARYFGIKVADLNGKNRSRSIARPRQVAMALAKDLTSKSLPEIGDFFGGRDHTTVLHAVRKIKSMMESDAQLVEDYRQLERLLQT